ncbi:hypothetical protein FOXB_13833 [Fusarium oxysporum f. sp. conglutinans Fo5176]|uniref:Uncharacterized protein n=1 Tax=Fusarium oxysporum (strain Fo5176) TaxID=660025 RepID=F9G5A1_FUSOF|nr:hypothetical protein FOXB_13833 [Fusarium oxysporum f. sp. conglutinans Fo5176]
MPARSINNNQRQYFQNRLQAIDRISAQHRSHQKKLFEARLRIENS